MKTGDRQRGPQPRDPRRPRLSPLQRWWLIIGLLAIGSWTAGYVGWMQVDNKVYKISKIDAAYHSLQLFTLEQGGQIEGKAPGALNVARFLSPAIAVWAGILTLAGLFSRRLREQLVRLLKGHVVVCGAGRKGLKLALAFRRAGREVLVIEREAENPHVDTCRRHGISVLVGDATDPDVLRRAGVEVRAQHLIAVCGDGGANAEVAVLARQLVNEGDQARPSLFLRLLARAFPGRFRRQSALVCFAHILDPELCDLLRERLLSTSDEVACRLEFFNLDKLGAQSLLEEHPAWNNEGPQGSVTDHVLIVGTGSFGQALLACLAANWLDGSGDASDRLPLTLVDPDVDACIEKMLLQYERFEKFFQINAVKLDVQDPKYRAGAFLREHASPGPVTAAYVCVSEDERSLPAALALHRAAQDVGVRFPIYVAMKETSGLTRLIGSELGRATEFSEVRTFGVLERTCGPQVLNLAMNEVIAQEIHEDYRKEARKRGETPETNKNMKPWEEVDERTRDDNRTQADSIAPHLRAVGYRIVSRRDFTVPPITFPPEVVDRLARQEHERWCRHKERKGWKYGETRDDARKIHTLLLPWEKLDDVSRGKDVSAVEAWPRCLAKAAFDIRPISSACDG